MLILLGTEWLRELVMARASHCVLDGPVFYSKLGLLQWCKMIKEAFINIRSQ